MSSHVASVRSSHGSNESWTEARKTASWNKEEEATMGPQGPNKSGIRERHVGPRHLLLGVDEAHWRVFHGREHSLEGSKR